MGMDNVIFELEVKVVVDCFNKPSNDLSYFDFIIKDCISSLNSFCSNSLVEFFRRQANVGSHELAREIMYMANPQVLELMSNCIVDAFYNDMR
jgi:hypothetical protein